MKKSNLQRHFDSFHGNLKKLTGHARQDKIDVVKRGLNAQQTALKRYCKTDNDIIARLIMILFKQVMKLAN